MASAYGMSADNRFTQEFIPLAEYKEQQHLSLVDSSTRLGEYLVGDDNTSSDTLVEPASDSLKEKRSDTLAKIHAQSSAETSGLGDSLQRIHAFSSTETSGYGDGDGGASPSPDAPYHPEGLGYRSLPHRHPDSHRGHQPPQNYSEGYRGAGPQHQQQHHSDGYTRVPHHNPDVHRGHFQQPCDIGYKGSQAANVRVQHVPRSTDHSPRIHEPIPYRHSRDTTPVNSPLESHQPHHRSRGHTGSPHSQTHQPVHHRAQPPRDIYIPNSPPNHQHTLPHQRHPHLHSTELPDPHSPTADRQHTYPAPSAPGHHQRPPPNSSTPSHRPHQSTSSTSQQQVIQQVSRTQQPSGIKKAENRPQSLQTRDYITANSTENKNIPKKLTTNQSRIDSDQLHSSTDASLSTKKALKEDIDSVDQGSSHTAKNSTVTERQGSCTNRNSTHKKYNMSIDAEIRAIANGGDKMKNSDSHNSLKKEYFLGKDSKSTWMTWSQDRRASFKKRMESMEERQKTLEENRVSTPVRKARKESVMFADSQDGDEEEDFQVHERLQSYVPKGKRKPETKEELKLSPYQWSALVTFWEHPLFIKCRWGGITLASLSLVITIISLTNQHWSVYPGKQFFIKFNLESFQIILNFYKLLF